MSPASTPGDRITNADVAAPLKIGRASAPQMNDTVFRSRLPDSGRGAQQQGIDRREYGAVGTRA